MRRVFLMQVYFLLLGQFDFVPNFDIFCVVFAEVPYKFSAFIKVFRDEHTGVVFIFCRNILARLRNRRTVAGELHILSRVFRVAHKVYKSVSQTLVLCG